MGVTNTQLKTDKPARESLLRVHVLTQTTDTAEQWLTALEKQADAIEKLPVEKRWKEHRQWWHDFWNRSWIFVDAKNALPLPVNQHPWRVGVASNGGSRFGGTITGPRVIGRALSAAEIEKLAGQQPSTETKLDEERLTTGCTVAAWIKPIAGAAGRILDKCTAGTPDGITFDTHPGLSLRWIVGNDTMIQPNCLKPGAWQHVAATADVRTGVRRVYLNGKIVKEEPSGPTDAETLTRGYTLQRWINACGGRGAFPIKFNGSIFVVDNAFDADYRAWGGGYWFQNTRLPYWSMLTSGDFDLMQPLFAMYLKALPARKLAAKNYYGHGGAFYPETMSFFGNYLDQGLGYGTNRTGKPHGLTDNQYIRRYWQGGIELVAMMLDYYDLTQDTKFRDDTLLPLASEIIAFFDQHWKRGANGKILFHPAQSLETWWDCTNPTPDIAGLRYVIPRLQRLTSDIGRRAAWQKTLDDLPPIPLGGDGKTGPKFILPAERFAAEANWENPELYAVFPYRVYTVAAGNDALDIGKATWSRRRNPQNGGWQQNSIQAAHLGLAGEARKYVVDSASRHADGFRFTAIWGPNADWMPDQDHGSVMVCALQRMLVQYEGRRILLLPAWPKDWNASFKLHAPANTTVEGRVENGKLLNLKVIPESRRRDVEILSAPGEHDRPHSKSPAVGPGDL